MSDNNLLVERIQRNLKRLGQPAWLFYGFHEVDPIALSILGFGPDPHISRRWFYLIPVEGQPRKLVHRIESCQLDHLPGGKSVYLKWQELQDGLSSLLADVSTVATQYSPENSIPYVSKVDAGTIELIRSTGTEVVSSADGTVASGG